jgi:hypothetical protein
MGKPVKSASQISVPLSPQPRRLRPALTAAAALLALALAPAVHAQPAAPAAVAAKADEGKEAASCLVRTIHALHDGSAFDAQLEPLKAQLKSPALSAWKSFKQLDKQELTLPAKSPQSFNVPGDHRGSLQFLEKVEKDGKQRLRLRLELFDGAAKLLSTVVLIDNGGTMLQAGTKHAGGTLILGFTCQIKKP